MKTPFRSQTSMTNARLGELIAVIDAQYDGDPGHWRLTIHGRDLLVITDETHNRMRIMAPIAPQDQLDEADLTRLLEANYDRALDAKFALNDGVLWSVYMHPLAELTDAQFTASVYQVATLADNFGTTYSSSNLVFRGR